MNSDDLWRAYQLGRISADHTPKQVFCEVIDPVLARLADEARRHTEQTIELVNLAEGRRVRLAEVEALLREALPAVQSYARKHGRAVVAAARRNDADHAAKHAAVEQSAWGLADKIRAYLPPDSAAEQEIDAHE